MHMENNLCQRKTIKKAKDEIILLWKATNKNKLFMQIQISEVLSLNIWIKSYTVSFKQALKKILSL